MAKPIIWDISGEIVDLGFISLKYYSLAFLLAFFSSYIILKKRFKGERIKAEMVDALAVYVFFGTLIGARLGHCLFYDLDYYSQHPLEIFLPFSFSPSFRFTGFQGLASHGGGIGILISLLLFSRKYKVKPWFLLDEISLVVPLAGFFIRLGNFMNSEIVGRPSSLPWAFVFRKVDDIPRHPTQLYEALGYLAIFIVSYRLMKVKTRGDGYYLGLMLVFVFSFRFAVEFLKENQSSFESEMPLDMGQLLSIPFVFTGIILMLKGKKLKDLSCNSAKSTSHTNT